MITAFTGPTDLSPKQRLWCAHRIVETAPLGVWRSGCAYGLDTLAAYLAIAIEVELELYVPFARHNGTLVRELAQNAHVFRCDGGPDDATSYRIRNKAMVKGIDRLLAFVRAPGFYRSGEWMTINLARANSLRNMDNRIIIRKIPKEGEL